MEALGLASAGGATEALRPGDGPAANPDGSTQAHGWAPGAASIAGTVRALDRLAEEPDPSLLVAQGWTGCGGCSSAVAVIGCARRSVAVPSASAAVDEPAEQTTVSRYPAEADADTDVFRFPDDRGGKLMAALLEPSLKTPLALTEAPARPRQRPTSWALEEPTVPLPRPEVGPARALAFKASPTARPRTS